MLLEGLLAGLRERRVSHEPPADLARALLAAADEPAPALLQRLGSAEGGLTPEQAATLRQRIGLNLVEQDPPLAWWQHLWHCYRTPFDLLLSLLALLSWIGGDHAATAVIASMVLLSVGLRFVQERRSHAAADRLKAMVSNTATVLRPDPAGGAPQPVEQPMAWLVPGDLVHLSAGDLVPADARLLQARDLFVAQSAMTGESLPVEKFADVGPAPPGSALDRPNLIFMGTHVVSGTAQAVVLATGSRSYFGALAQRLGATDPEPTSFQAGVNRVAWLLIRFMLVMAPLVCLINGWTKGDWSEALLFAMSIAVGLTPEMLPMIVTSTLAKGAVALSRLRVIVKRLDAIQAFGSMDVLCTDKTGTLTQDRICLARHTNAWGEASDAVLAMACLNSHYQTGLKNLLDVAVLEHAEVLRGLDLARNYRRVDEIPFDFQRRRMSVVVAERESHHLLVCKGAVEETLAACTRVRRGELDEPLTPALLAQVHAVTDALNADGLRVVAVALREMPLAQQRFSVADEQGLTLLGYIAFLDPPKESTRPALQALAARGIAVKVLTGDNDRVAAKVCRDVGLAVKAPLLGSQVDAMDEHALALAVEEHTVFAKLAPAHKERIVRALRANGHVVGFVGDGINDAPALRAADVGISVDTAVDIAKEAADIILLEKSLLVLRDGVDSGRRTFANLLKYLRLTASSNFGNVFSVLVASALLPFLPMLPMQLLVQNLLYDLSQVAIPFDAVDADQLRDPQRWHAADIGRFMLCFGPLSSAFDLLTYAVLWWGLGAATPAAQSLFQSGWFVEGLLTQTLVVHMIRTRRLPFVQSRPAPLLLGATLAVAAVGLLLPMGPWAHVLHMQPLPGAYFAALAAILLGYALAAQALKTWYARRFGWQ